MNIQFNLLPDIKIEFIKSRRTKRLMMLVSVITMGISVVLLGFMFSYRTVQRQHFGNLNKDITDLRAELEGNTELSKMLSVQNQLKTLPALYDGRPAADRLPLYLDQLTPVNVSINNLAIDFSQSTVMITGSGENISAINAYVDTLKFTSFSSGTDQATPPAFKDVVLTSFGRSDDKVSFTIDASFDPRIFDATLDITLTVPNIVTTRAQSVQNDQLFVNPPAEEDQ